MKLVVIGIVLFAACGDDRPASPDAPSGVRVTGCDDPSLWEAPALEEGRLYALVGGEPCGPVQYPLHRAVVGWYPTDDTPADDRIDRTCWRITDASPASGWVAGQTFTGDGDGASISMTGFGSSLTLEGRVLRDDGTVVFALPGDAVSLRPSHVLDTDASATIAVMSPRTWVERNAVHAFDLEVGIDEIVDASGMPLFDAGPTTVHRTASGFVYRTWRRVNDQLLYEQVALGSGTRARVAKFGAAIVIDSELLFVGNENNVDRIALGAEPLEITGNYSVAMLHSPGTLVAYLNHGTQMRSLSVGDGALLPVPRDDAPVFFDGTSFRRPDFFSSPPTLGPSFTPRAEDLAAIGTPRSMFYGIVLGDEGLLVAVDGTEEILGPRVASYAELFGDPTARLGPISIDGKAYVIRTDDGAMLYEAPYEPFCE